MSNNKPMRLCISCRNSFEKNTLLRVVNVDGIMVVDHKHKINARGAYICCNDECISLAKKRGAFKRVFKGLEENDIYTQLAGEINGKTR